jgi:hypothetical protein
MTWGSIPCRGQGRALLGAGHFKKPRRSQRRGFVYNRIVARCDLIEIRYITMTTLVHSGDLGREETLPRRRRPRAATTTEFARALDVLNLTQLRAAQLFGVNVRHVRRWGRGDRRVPRGVDIVLRLLAAGAISIDQVEQAAVLIPARTNGSAKPELPASLLIEPTPAPAPTDLDLTTAEKVFALAPNACRWPCGDPRRADFHFCGNPVAERPYCERHRTMAYMVPLTRSLSKAEQRTQRSLALSDEGQVRHSL